MKIVFNTDQIFMHGGVEKVMATKANYFSSLRGVEVFIVTSEQKNLLPCYRLNKDIHLLDLGVNYNRSKSYFSKENIRKAFIHYRKQKKLFKQLKPDVLISPNYNFDHYWLPFICGKAKVIKERHSSCYLETENRKSASWGRRLLWKLNDRVDKKYSAIVVLNKDEKEYVKSGNAVVIPNPIPVPSFRADLNNKRVLAAGRIAPVKAFDKLIKIWSMVVPNFPEWQLHIYGDDYVNTKEKLENLVRELQLENSVLFKKPVADLTDTMKEYSIYTMTSETECFPMVLLEALSVGMPVVSYDCPNGPRNIITQKEDGFVVENKNKTAFAEDLTRLMEDETLRKKMGESAKKNAVRFSIPKVMRLWQETLNLPDE